MFVEEGGQHSLGVLEKVRSLGDVGIEARCIQETTTANAG